MNFRGNDKNGRYHIPDFLNSFTCSNQGSSQSTFWLETQYFCEDLQEMGRNPHKQLVWNLPVFYIQKIALTNFTAEEQLDNYFRNHKRWFRPNRSCADLIFTLQSLIEKRWEWQSNIYMVFINFEKIFYSVECHSLWEILLHHGIPKKIVLLIIALSLSQWVLCEDTVWSNAFLPHSVRNSTRVCFVVTIFVIDYIIWSTITVGIQLNPKVPLRHIGFAENIAILESCKQRLQELLDQVRERDCQGDGNWHRTDVSCQFCLWKPKPGIWTRNKTGEFLLSRTHVSEEVVWKQERK